MEGEIAGCTGMGNFNTALGIKIKKIAKENRFSSMSVALTQMMHNLPHNVQIDKIST